MKTAFVLSGGGAKGAFQVGAIKQLAEKGIHPDIIYGTSVGALNAAAYGTVGIDALIQEWSSVKDKSSIIYIRWLYWIFTLGMAPKGFYSTNPLRKKLMQLSGMPFRFAKACVTKVSLKTGLLTYAYDHEPDFLVSALASATIPVVMEPVDDEWVDGGAREQTPLARAIEDGCTRIIVMLCNPVEGAPLEEWKCPWWARWFNILVRLADDIMTHEIFRNDLKLCKVLNTHSDYTYIDLTVYAPEKLLLNTLDFTQEKIQPAIKQGLEAQPLDLTRL